MRLFTGASFSHDYWLSTDLWCTRHIKLDHVLHNHKWINQLTQLQEIFNFLSCANLRKSNVPGLSLSADWIVLLCGASSLFPILSSFSLCQDVSSLGGGMPAFNSVCSSFLRVFFFHADCRLLRAEVILRPSALKKEMNFWNLGNSDRS